MNKQFKALDVLAIVAITVRIIIMLIGLLGIITAGRRDYTAYGDIIRPIISSSLFTAGFLGLYIQLLICNIKTIKLTEYEKKE